MKNQTTSQTPYYSVVIDVPSHTENGRTYGTMYAVVGQNGERYTPNSYGSRSAKILCNKLNKKHEGAAQ